MALGNQPLKLTVSLYLRLLALVYLCAFALLLPQLEGLYSVNGFAPVANYGLLQWVTSGGCLLSILLFFGFAEPFVLFLLYLAYLHIVSVGQEFLSFQWDTLLLEAGFISIFLGRSRYFSFSERTTKIATIALAWLTFRLMFSSGFVKIVSEAVSDSTWLSLTALKYHFETQPLPNPVAFFCNAQPLIVSKLACAIALAIEIVVPFFVFAGAKARLAAAIYFCLLQLAIALTGNYGFFNFLSAVLCLSLVSDQELKSLCKALKLDALPPLLLKINKSAQENNDRLRQSAEKLIAYSAFLVIALASVISMGLTALGRDFYAVLPEPVALGYGLCQNFGVSSTYGLFAVMTRDRPELIVEGSNDDIEYKAYEFNYKIGDLYKAPPIVAPYMPRLDWQMWFEALRAESGANPDRWFVHFLRALAQGDESVLQLLKYNPFADTPPKYLRVKLYKYTFTKPEVLFSKGQWWQREEVGVYLHSGKLGIDKSR